LDPARLADLQRERVDPHVGVRAGIERAVAERLHGRVELGSHLGGPGLGDVLDPERLDQPVDAAGRHALDVALGHDLDEGPLGTPAWL
jgi:hypothetical protein